MIVDDMSIGFCLRQFPEQKEGGTFFQRQNVYNPKELTKWTKPRWLVSKNIHTCIYILHIFLIKFLHRSLQKKDPILTSMFFNWVVKNFIHLWGPKENGEADLIALERIPRENRNLFVVGWFVIVSGF